MWLASCTAIRPAPDIHGELGVGELVSHADFDRVLKRFVDERGFVDYSALREDPEDLERYFHLLSVYSPDSHPALFPTEAHKLAYWINAYNATSIKIALSHYPISSVLDVKPPALLFFLPRLSGFFVFQRVTYGGEMTNLYHLENGVIRKRFGDPRVHFALNCSARGCPRLPRGAFSAERLDEQLERAAFEFLSEDRNFRLDHETRIVYLSEIFDWYESDYLDWYREEFPEEEASVPNYVALYLPPERAAELKDAADAYEVEFVPFDWRLNDQRKARSGDKRTSQGTTPETRRHWDVLSIIIQPQRVPRREDDRLRLQASESLPQP